MSDKRFVEIPTDYYKLRKLLCILLDFTEKQGAKYSVKEMESMCIEKGFIEEVKK